LSVEYCSEKGFWFFFLSHPINKMANKNYSGRSSLIATISIALLLTLTLAANRTFYGSRARTTASAQEAERAGENAQQMPANAAQPFVVSDSSSAIELGRSINRLIDESEFANARWGVFVTSLRDGRVLYARNADKAFAPASNMKLYTTAVALDMLGADYRWRTSVYAEAEPDKNGTIAGDLSLYGRGAPDFSSSTERDEPRAALEQLAEQLYSRGVRRVRGDIVGDESYFRGDPLGDGWLWNDVQWYFGAEVSALTINDNEVNVSVTPASKPEETAAIRLKPDTAYIHVENDTTTVERGSPSSIGITRGLSDNNLRVWGDFPVGGRVIGARLSVHQPALWAATLFQDALKRRGITVEGKARSVDARENKKEAGVNTESAVELAFVTSKTLGQIARLTNKESINLYAELILRTLGKEHGMSAPTSDPKKMRTRGDDEAGVAVIRQWLEDHVIAVDALALHDGSGLSRLDLVTPEATARLLVAMTKNPSAEVFRDSLPVAGRDGTLKYRLRSTPSGRIVAKTGTLTYINSLSGYVTTADDELLAFSIICNDETEAESSTRIVDAIAATLASYRE
jgi:D-alanyl-D-alanine carboxypeptidase/D-alanyl-D-alanine-endopeptidase (penicillin-binding protein 4)